MNKFLIMAFCALTLTACQSVHKPPMPKGKWVAVNQTGFIPPNITKYRDDISTLTQDVENQEQEQMGETP